MKSDRTSIFPRAAYTCPGLCRNDELFTKEDERHVEGCVTLENAYLVAYRLT